MSWTVSPIATTMRRETAGATGDEDGPVLGELIESGAGEVRGEGRDDGRGCKRRGPANHSDPGPEAGQRRGLRRPREAARRRGARQGQRRNRAEEAAADGRRRYN